MIELRPPATSISPSGMVSQSQDALERCVSQYVHASLSRLVSVMISHERYRHVGAIWHTSLTILLRLLRCLYRAPRAYHWRSTLSAEEREERVTRRMCSAFSCTA